MVRCLVTATIACVLLIAGCSKESDNSAINTASDYGNELVNDAQDVASEAVSSAKQQLPPSGNISLSMKPAVNASSCSIRLINFDDDRGSVVQISNYPFDQKPSTYPQVFIQGRTSETSLASIVGKSIECDLFVRSSGSDPIIATSESGSVRVRFRKVDVEKQTIPASISRSRLEAIDGSTVSLSSGSITAVMPETADAEGQE